MFRRLEPFFLAKLAREYGGIVEQLLERIAFIYLLVLFVWHKGGGGGGKGSCKIEIILSVRSCDGDTLSIFQGLRKKRKGWNLEEKQIYFFVK